MVDEIGGLEKAIAFAADQGDLVKGQYDVRVLPAPKTLADLFAGGDVQVDPAQDRGLAVVLGDAAKLDEVVQANS